MREKIDPKARPKAHQDAKPAAKKGGPGAVNAARNLVKAETSGARMEKEPKFKVLDNKALEQVFGERLIGKPRSEVRELVKQKYGDKVPGLEHREYLINNFDKVPEQLKDGNYYYFLRDLGADGGVPCASWDSYGLFRLGRSAGSPEGEWGESERVLLLE